MIKSLICCFVCLLSAILVRFVLTENKKQYLIDLRSIWKIILFGILFQIALVILFTKNQTAISVIESISSFMSKLKDATLEGTKFVFGYLSSEELPFVVKPNSSIFIFAFQTLPTIILVSVLSAILNYTKILPFISKLIGIIIGYIFKLRKSISMVTVAKIFLGQIEAPLLIKPELNYLKRFDMFLIMSLAFSTTSAAVMPMYSDVLKSVCPNAMNHLIISSVLNVISTIIICYVQKPVEDRTPEINNLPNKTYNNIFDAISKGLADGASAWWGIVGSLIGMVALVAFINYILSTLAPITLQQITSVFMYPIAWLLGINNSDISQFAQLLGTKMVVNETVAFFDLASMHLSQESVIKAIYILNNFGNFACIGITVVGLQSLSNNSNITQLAGKAFFSGFIATIFTTALIGIFGF